MAMGISGVFGVFGATGWGRSELEAFGRLLAAGEDGEIAVKEVGFGVFRREELAMV